MKIRVLENFYADLGKGARNYGVACSCCDDYLGVFEIDDKFAIDNDLVNRLTKYGVAEILVMPKEIKKTKK